MEITNEIKAKIFAQYFGQRIKKNDWMGELYSVSTYKSHEDPAHIELATPTVIINYDINDVKLILKSLSAITDEDAIEASGIIGGASHLSNESQINQLKGLFSSPNFFVNQTNISGYKWLQCIQFFQSKGYDLPNYLLGGKTLQEVGLAIYEPASKKYKI